MTRKHTQLQYSPRRRRTRLAERRIQPVALLLLALALIAALAIVCVRFILPAIRAAAFAEAQAAAQAQAEAARAADDDEKGLPSGGAGTVALVDVADAQYLFDPSVSDDTILFAAGMARDRLDRLVRYDTRTGEAAGVLVPMRYDTLRNPVEDDARIVYMDAKAGGGGAIRVLDKATGEMSLVCEIAYDVPVLCYETPYLTWKERTPDGATKLYVCHLGAFDAVTLAVLDEANAAASLPSLAAGAVLYADTAADGAAVIRTVQLADGDVSDYAPGTGVHDPKRLDDLLAWTSGSHGEDNDLYCSVNGAAAERVAEGVIDFGVTEGALVYGLHQAVYAYAYGTGETVRISGAGENAQLAAAGGRLIVWRSMADPANPVWKYRRLD